MKTNSSKKYSFFQHTECEYFPCHSSNKIEDFNCLFCYCPLYTLGDKCGGNFSYTDSGHKSCVDCMLPHVRNNYDKVIGKYPLLKELASQK